jgi:MoxR-like ATPase
MIRLAIGYPDAGAEAEILAAHGAESPLEQLEPVADAPTVAEMAKRTRRVAVAPALHEYIVQISDATRSHPEIFLGASPRASIMLLRAARAYAAAAGRDYVVPDDVKELAVPVLSHRVLLSPDAAMAGRSVAGVIEEILEKTAVPVPGSG